MEGGGSQAHKNRLSLNPETGVYLPFGFLTVCKVKIRHPSVQTNSDPDPTRILTTDGTVLKTINLTYLKLSYV